MSSRTPGRDHDFLLRIYRELLLPRRIEERMLLLLRQGRVSKWFSGIGQEAISVGVTLALEPDEMIFPLHRNLGVFTVRGAPLPKLFAQLQGKPAGFTKARDRSFHFGSIDHHIVGMISHLGPQLALAGGVALAHRLKGEKKIAVAFSGEGGTSEGDFHEALNVAAVWSLPVIFVIENNGYGLSTPSREQFRIDRLSEKASGYGMQGVTIDGNDVLAVYDAVRDAAKRMRTNPEPLLLECMTFRMRGHEEASGTKYVPSELFAQWQEKDPISRLERVILDGGAATKEELDSIRAQLDEEILAAVESGFGEADAVPDATRELADVYAPSTLPVIHPLSGQRKRRLVDAVSDALAASLERFSELVLMGQDIAEYGGVFKVTEGFVERFGRERIRNTPLCESAIVGAALGLSLGGMKAVVEMQFADFVSCAFTQIVNNLAKLHYRWGQNADVVVRLPTGAGARAGPFHSQSNEAWFFHVPGLVLVYPAFPSDAKGLLCAAIENPNPVLFFEHKGLYRSVEEDVPDGYYTVEIGKARTIRSGDEVTIVTYGAGVHWALDTLSKNPDIDADLIDLRTLLPYDWAAIAESVRRTGRVIVLHEDTLTGGIGAELCARISEELFDALDAPPSRCAALDTPVPFAAPLEDEFLPRARFEGALRALLRY